MTIICPRAPSTGGNQCDTDVIANQCIKLGLISGDHRSQNQATSLRQCDSPGMNDDYSSAILGLKAESW